MPTIPKPPREARGFSLENRASSYSEHSAHINALLQAAADFANTAPGYVGICQLPRGPLYLSSQIYAPTITAKGSKLVIRGWGQDETIFYPTPEMPTNQHFLRLNNNTNNNNPWLGNTHAAIAPVSRGATTCTVVSGTVPTVGELWALTDTGGIWQSGTETATYKNYQLVTVQAVNGATITFTPAAVRDFSIGLPRLYRMEEYVSKGVELYDASFQCLRGSSYLQGGVIAQEVANLKISRVRAQYYRDSAITIAHSTGVTIQDITCGEGDPALYSSSGYLRGIDQYWSDDIYISGVVGNNLRHTLQGSTISNFTWEDITVTNCRDASLDLHGQESIDGVIQNCSISAPESRTNYNGVKLGNTTFNSWERNIEVKNIELDELDILCQGAQDCTLYRCTGVRRLIFESRLGSEDQGAVDCRDINVVETKCATDGYIVQLEGRGAFNISIDRSILTNTGSGSTQAIGISGLTRAALSTLTITNSWIDVSNGTGHGLLVFDSQSNPGSAMVTVASSIFNLNTVGSALYYSNTYSPYHIWNLFENRQYGNGLSFLRSSLIGNLSIGSEVNNTAPSAVAESTPETIEDLLSFTGLPPAGTGD